MIQIKTWTKDYTDIYNYDSPEQKSTSILINKKGYLIRSKNNVAFIEYNGFNKYKQSYDRFKICEIDYINDNYYFKVEYSDNEISYDIDNKVYILANSINGKLLNENYYYGYELNEGDIIKIGRYKIKVRRINLNNKNITNNIDNESINSKNDKNEISYDDIKSKDSNNKLIDKLNIKSNNTINNNNQDKQCRIYFQND